MKTAILPMLALLAPPVAAAQTLEPLIQEGDPVAGIGNVTSISALSINDMGEWFIELDTDHPSTDLDGAVLYDGALFLREGDALAAPAGAVVDSFDSVVISDNGHACWNLFLDGTTGLSDDSGFFFNTTLLVQEGDSPAIAGLSAGTSFQGFFDAKPIENGAALLLATVDDPAIPTSVDQVLLRAFGATPGSLTLTVIAKEGDALPGQTETIEDFNTGPHDFAFSDSENTIFFADLTGPTSSDGVIYMNSTLLAQEGSPSPVAGRNWSSLSSAKVDVNDVGQHVYSGSLDGDSATNSVLIRTGAKFMQEGDSPADIAPFQLTSFGSGPLWIDNAGNVLWYGDWDDPDTSVDTGLFLNERLLVQEGVSAMGGVVVDTLRGVQDGYVLSDDGAYVVFEAVLADGTEGAYRITLGDGSVTPMSDCLPSGATLVHSGGSAVIGGSFDLEMDNAQVFGAFSAVAFSDGPIPGWPSCGLVLPGFGEVLIDIAPPNPLASFVGPLWLSAPITIPVPIPDQLGLVGVTVYGQGVFVDIAGITPVPVRATGGVIVNIGI